ncbi:hypothetical protein [Gloeocapsopsis crepidinum]|uniref:hypothetical protein n=1 Tax=Gloeocapsopsis crepidinum TaxID=693223 RepID=UPI001D146B11|nr:hypothetical protein [Gloeocapsopsis crepidinum]
MAQAFHAAPIVSSRALGWEPLIAEEFQQPPGGIDTPEAWEGHAIALCLAPKPHLTSCTYQENH